MNARLLRRVFNLDLNRECVSELGLCDLGKISNCDFLFFYFFFDRYCDCDLICDFTFAKSSFSSILSIMCSTV